MHDPSEGLELRHLVTLASVSRTLSFSRTADELGYSQSAVSQQIGRLERLLGQRLVERRNGARQVALTQAGRVLIGHAEAMVARLHAARADLEALDDGTAGVLRLGCYQSVGTRLLPRVIREFSTTWPQVQVELHEQEDDAALLGMVERGDLDLTFVALPMPPGPYAYRELLEDPYVAVVHRDSPIGANGAPLDPRELGGPLATYGRMRSVHAIEHRLGRPELTGRILFRSNDNGTIIGLVAEQVCTAVVSWLSVDPAHSEVRSVPLAGVVPRVVAIAWHRERHLVPAAHAFVRVAQQQALDLQRAAPQGVRPSGSGAGELVGEQCDVQRDPDVRVVEVDAEDVRGARQAVVEGGP